MLAPVWYAFGTLFPALVLASVPKQFAMTYHSNNSTTRLVVVRIFEDQSIHHQSPSQLQVHKHALLHMHSAHPHTQTQHCTCAYSRTNIHQTRKHMQSRWLFTKKRANRLSEARQISPRHCQILLEGHGLVNQGLFVLGQVSAQLPGIWGLV